MAEPFDIDRLIGDVVRFVRVESVDLAAARCVVSAGELLSGPIPWLAPAAGETRIWSPPSAGEQGLLICPEGDIAAGVFMRGVFSTDFPAPVSSAVETARFSDGSIVSYDPALSELVLQLVGKARLVAPAGLEIEADVAITGDVAIAGKLDASGNIATPADVKAGDITLKTHRTSGVQTGAGTSLGPVP